MAVYLENRTPIGAHVVTLEVVEYSVGRTVKTTFQVTREYADFGTEPEVTKENTILWAASELSKRLRLPDPESIRFVSHSYEVSRETNPTRSQRDLTRRR